MPRRTNMFPCFVLTMCFFGAVIGAEFEIQDFEFADNDDDVNIVKRAAVYMDDEDFLADEQGSTPGTEYEGSGTTTVSYLTKVPFSGDYPRFFRVSVLFSNLEYTAGLDDRGSSEFTQQSEILSTDIQSLFRSVQGRSTVTVLQYSAMDGVLVTFDLGYEGFASEDELRTLLETSTRSGRIGPNAVSSDEFSFRFLDASSPTTRRRCQLDELLCAQNQVCIPRVRACDGSFDCADGTDEKFCPQVQCPAYVGRSPEYLPRNGTNFASLLINNAFPCAGTVVGWEYYRLIPQGSAFVGVWKQSGEDEFVLVKKTELPAAQTGKRTVQVDDPIQVERGDFIGIFYPRSTPNNVIAQATLADDAVAANEMYQTYYAQFFDHMVYEGVPFDLSTVPHIPTNTTFAIRAVMSYDGTNGAVGAYTCKSNEFSCGDLFCIEAEYRCDGQDDCNNGLDEQNCPSVRCLEDEFTCKSGECIAQFLRCNQENDCQDGSDEVDCTVLPVVCASNEYRCLDGTCISLSLRCDSRPDCQGGDDEFGCSSKPCASGEFRCEYGQCIPLVQRCDQVNQCPDMSDELDCPCREDEYTCQNGECIPSSRFCDAQPDCSDNSDEDRDLCLPTIPTFPPACLEGFFRCTLGICVESYKRCDGVNDCPDSSDELECELRRCREGEFRCNNGMCIDARLQCDGLPDCEDLSDESRCVQTCGPAEFTCNSGQCIDLRRRCDSYPDCLDQSDETGCPCRADQFECSDGQCISGHLKCDRSFDCRDSSDERNCSCQDQEFRCGDGQCIPQSQVCDRVVNCIDTSDERSCEVRCSRTEFQCNDGTCIDRRSKCDRSAQCPDSSDEFNCTCNTVEFRCQNGQCISQQAFCNRRQDCVDGTDEINCPQACREDQFTCGSGECIDRRRTCDGRADCRDRLDEQNCPVPPSFQCMPGQFRCATGQCIDSGFKCDRQVDCLDRSDETRCPTSRRCPEDKFQCDSGHCLDMQRRCDGRRDCPQGSDEVDCPTCSPAEFTCANSQCISSAQRCDRRSDCLDGSDERNCPCATGEFTCVSDGRCLPPGYRCNGNPDCRDGSDEQDCVSDRCGEGEFRCGGGECIDARLQCDSMVDCPDSSDEDNCVQPCRDTDFRCLDGQCVALIARCNGSFECQDRSDEQSCVQACTSAEFRCSDGQCVAQTARCDRRFDCQDGSDERDCVQACTSAEFRCSDGQCVAQTARCDRRFDCQDESDERDCVQACTSAEFRCSNGQCVAQTARCDRRYDCQDGSDERDCDSGITVVISPQQMRKQVGTSASFICQVTGNPAPRVAWSRRSGGAMPTQAVDSNGRLTIVDLRLEDAGDYVCQANSPAGIFESVASLEVEFTQACTSAEFRCLNGQCVAQTARCDRRYDCQDGSDERDCDSGITVVISPQQMRKRVGTSASFICQVTGSPAPRVAWSRRSGGAMPTQAVDSNGRLTIIDLRLEDAGDYVCQANSPAGIFESVARLEVEFIGPQTVEPGTGGPCSRDEATCSSGQCIPRDYLCDGEPDCSDGSDERNCNIALPCEPNEFRCNNGRCAMKIWRCDGDNDCLDNSDESNCPTRVPGAPCRTDEFMCRTNDQCIPFAYQCDGEIDCQDRSDEIGCTQPSIVVPPVPEITVEINGSFTIICEALGTPTPLIVWRLNWGNVPVGDRVTVTSVDGRGALIVRNAVTEDAGAYTCEAINNRGSIFAIPDALIIVRRTVGVCQVPRFNADATRPEQCYRCFCFGHTQTCFSSNLQTSQITLGNQVALVKRTTLEPTEQGFVQYIPTSREFEVRDFNRVLRTGSYYWSLPHQYLSKRLSSYGGELTYRAYYEVDGFDVPTSDPDVIIVGNGITLYHKSKSDFRPKASTFVNVPLVETSWERSRGSPRDGPISEYATREDLMQVLDNVTTILVRATYDNRQSLVRLGGVLLTTGVPQATGLGRAVSVEECICPTGYTGFSCEECAPGFYKVDQGRFGRECIACNCNGHSNDCDPSSGFCRNCRDNTVGPYCNECAAGYVGDARGSRPDACQPCPCPLTTPENQFSRSCVLDSAGIICTDCPEGYTGRSCDRCASGYRGNPLTPGDRCIRDGEIACDQRGSLTSLPDLVTQQCGCKANVEGQYCNRCKPDTFYLSGDYPYGCLACFCMGVTQTCQSTAWNRAQISLPFTQPTSDVVLTDMMQQNPVSQGLSIDRQTRELVFRGFNNVDRSIRYWSLPQQFLGDKVTSYGGYLRFTIRYRAGRDSTPVNLNDPVVEIDGNGITFVHRLSGQNPEENKQTSFSVPFIETQWNRMDGVPATREHLLMALADLNFILIRATYTVDTEESAISGISLDIAENRNTGQERASPVEQCICPRGHKGLSCEDCDTGFTRTGGGLYLGLCEPCQCNGHSSECDPDSGVCRNCRHNTEGDHCESCSSGYHGNATRGSVYDCQKCPCPLTESPNQFSPECVLDTDGQVTCTSCPIGHSGRRCERCVDGYQGNPNQPGDYCKLINVTCDCDDRGTVPNTLCDPNTQLCPCRNNVQGRRCSACKDGYFHLNRDNEMGCQKCYCTGVSNQCTSSSYYRDEIVPMLNSDGTHNFQLTNRRLSRTISDGFTMNAERNEITFNNFEGIQREQESLFFSLPPKFRGDKISSYGGYLKFGLTYTTSYDTGREYMDVDVEIISKQDKRMYYLHRPSPKARETYSYDILLTENSFRMMDGHTPSREAFLSVLADIDAILIRATYHTAVDTVTLRDLRMEIAVPSVTGQRGAPEVESCVCPEGYTGLSCQACAAGYLTVKDSGTAGGQCVRCNCNGHATSCDPQTGVCQNCQDNTVGDRCERCAPGYYGDPTAGTPSDCRVCPCPLTLPSNQFSPTCFLDQDSRVTCQRCPAGYTGRDCGQCASDYFGNPREPGGRCDRVTVADPRVIVNPVSLAEPLGSTATFQCTPSGRGPFDVIWSRIDGRPLPRKATQGPGPNYPLTIPNLEYDDSARYVCQVTNAIGTIRDSVTLTVERPEPQLRVRIEDPTTIDTRPGQTARFICVAIQYSSAANYVLSWAKDGGILPSKSIDQNGVLVIPNLDANDVGTYTCTGSDPGSVDRATATIRFGDVEEPPSVRIDPRYLQVSEGDKVEFQCTAEGSPRPIIRWTKGPDGPLPDYIYSDETGAFRISSVSSSDQSEYYCTATNSQGSASVRTIIYVQRQSQIEVIVRRTNITAVIGQSEQLVCYVDDSSGVALVWTRDGGLPLGATQENGILTLTNIQPSYAGTYTCTGSTATSIVGRATSRITVTGRAYTAPTVRVEPERQTVGAGTTGSLRCIATGEPQPSITWSRANGQLSSNHQVTGEFLRISQASMEDRGIYVCTASNVAGTVQASAIVDIERREPPVVELYPDVQQARPTGSSALFQCRVVGGIPAPVVTWSRASGREFTSRTEVKADMGVLMFNSITAAEQGEYMCSATNEVGTVTATASLRVEGPPTIEITPSRSITSIVGDRVNIECVGIGDPTPTVIWRSGQRRRSDVLPEAYDSGPGTARLLFESIQKGDEGQYICVATNERGRTEETVDITIHELDGGDRRGVAIVGPERMSLITGQSAELTCSSSGLSNPRYRWRRQGNQPLPPGHSVRNGVLYIPRIEPENAGEYICSVGGETDGTEFSASIYIIVNVMPRLTISPSRVTSNPGQSLQLQCQPTGQGPFNIEWTKVDGQLSPQARENNGVLEIRQVTRADAGRYRCVATNIAGSTEGFADVVVVAPPAVAVTPKQTDTSVGSTVEIRCNVQADPQPTIQWERERGSLPLQHQIRNGVLTIYNAQPSDSGMYVCRATNVAGTAVDYSVLNVYDGEASPGVQRVGVGDRVELECVVTGSTTPTVTWTKLEGPLPQSSIIGEGILIIPEVRIEDAGNYQCTATNAAGTVRSRVHLFVSSRPFISAQQDYTTAALGTPAQLRCEAAGSPAPRVSWLKEEGDLPYDHSVLDTGDLYIPKVRQEDGGTYNCLATNAHGTAKFPVVLIIGAFVPYFQQNPASYMSFAPLSDAYLDLDIQLSFRPEATDGLVLYNGQYNTASGDFVCFGLQGQYPEFRFDVGSGAATIRGAQPLELNKWHTIHLKRNRKNGTMIVNDEPVYYGESSGDFQGLDLAEPLFVGNVPDTRAIPPSARFASGFVGGVSEIRVKGVGINIGAEARDIVSVEQYQVCRESPCQNEGACRPENNRFGFACDCPHGYAGLRCELIGERCYQGACGPEGRCFNWKAISGFSCVCPAGYTGEGCVQSITFVDPAFNKSSFISYPTINDGLLSVRIQLLFKPRSLDDGIVLYNAQRQDGRQDFIAIIIKDQHLEFRFDTGSGPAVLRSRQPLILDDWTIVVADRRGRDGMLIVNDEEPVNEQVEPNDGLLFSRLDRGDIIRGTTSGDKTIGLNLERPLYLGGVDPFETISSNAGTYDGFVGCIGELTIRDKTIRLYEDAVENLNIEDCGDRRLCERRPCHNNAQCVDISSTEYECFCTARFTGANCETEINICITRQPCHNDGRCVVLGSSYRCDCPLPWTGTNCEQQIALGTDVSFAGNGFAEFHKDLFPHLRKGGSEIISLTITTTSSNGLFFWQGQQPGEQGGKDYLSLALNDGFVEFGFELGSGPALIRSSEPVDDGFPHLVVIERLTRNGSVSIDNRAPVSGLSEGPLQIINILGSLFFGGVPDLNRYTDNLFKENFVGCLANVKIQNRVLDFGTDPLKGSNIKPCSSNL